MRIRDLISLGKEYLLLALILCTAIAVIFVIAYFVVYRKLLHGQKKIRATKLIWCGVMMIYLIVVAGATLLSRGGFYYVHVAKLFSSYREAYILQKPVLWRNIILNYLMFVPLGFLIPIGIKRFKLWWRVTACGFGLSLLIEVFQLILHRGIFEPDDLLANTVGCMIGYGVYRIFRQIIDKEEKLWETLLAQFPLTIVILAFLALFFSYSTQELGNNPNRVYDSIPMSVFEVDGLNSFDKEEKELMVYKLNIMSSEEAIEKGKQFFAGMGEELNESRVDIYDESVILYDTVGKHNLWINLSGSMRYTDFEELFPQEGNSTDMFAGATEEDVREALEGLHMNPLPEAVFSDFGNGRYRFDLNLEENEGKLYDGFLTCTLSADSRIAEFDDQIFLLEEYRLFPSISMKDAYEKIIRGEFQAYIQDSHIKITIEDARVGYSIDTKGYYQPDYCFDCVINGEKTTIRIPALK